MFCVLRGDSYSFSASSASFCHFRSLSFSLSSYLFSHSLRSVSCLSKKHLLNPIHTSLPFSWPEVHKLRNCLVTGPLRLTSVPTMCSAVQRNCNPDALNILLDFQISFIYMGQYCKSSFHMFVYHAKQHTDDRNRDVYILKPNKTQPRLPSLTLACTYAVWILTFAVQ